MTELSGLILEKWQVRKTRAQKDAFRALLQTHYPSLTVEEGGLGRNRNLLLGDPNAVEVIVGAHYDTCAVLPFPNLIAPKSLLLSVLYALLICIPFLVLSQAVRALVLLLTPSPLLAFYLSLTVFLLLFLLLLFGPANRHTANDNTSGVIALLELYEALPPALRERVCFVLFDNEEYGMLGSSFFKKRHGQAARQKLMLNFDCVSDGDHLLLVASRAAKARYEAALLGAFVPAEGKTVELCDAGKAFYPSDQSCFSLSVALAAFKKTRCGLLYLDRIHTRRDTQFDETNLTMLVSGAAALLQKLL